MSAPPANACLAAGGLGAHVAGAKVLVVGAGGIGCELLKNLVLTGFRDVTVVDLDTIDVSNLNRQFLFHRQHIGQPKAKVAVESALLFCPDAKLGYRHDSIIGAEYDVPFFEQFTVVLNALDNKAARNHVNRLCLAAKVPLVESGSSGYLGQVTVIRRGETECYECEPKAAAKTYPGCTIRNTPTEPIHCVVWAKHLFNQLFGECDIDEDVSPDTADPELKENGAPSDVAENGSSATSEASASDASKVSTRSWAAGNNYDAKMLFEKLFHTDIKYLLSMGRLWKARRAPTPLLWDRLLDALPGTASEPAPGSPCRQSAALKDQSVWTPLQCRDVFRQSVGALKEEMAAKEGGLLVWDKDSAACCDFATSAANLRAHAFGIGARSRFDVKSMAGNIVPAIASTNAIVAGMIVMEALKVVQSKWHLNRTMYISRLPNPRGKLLVDLHLCKPNAKCYVCSAGRREVFVKLNCDAFTLRQLDERVLKAALNMSEPDVTLGDQTGTIVISSEPGETDALMDKTLADMKIAHGARLLCDDFTQKLEFCLVVAHSNTSAEELGDGAGFELLTDVAPPSPEKRPSAAADNDTGPLDLVDDASPPSSSSGGGVKRPSAPSASSPTGAKRRRTNGDQPANGGAADLD